MLFDVTDKDCMHAAANDLNDFDATCTSRDNNVHSKVLGNGTDAQAHHASQFGQWAQQQSYSQDAGFDHDQLPAHQASFNRQQQTTHQVSAAQQLPSREQQKLQKKVFELEDMLEKIRQVGWLLAWECSNSLHLHSIVSATAICSCSTCSSS